MRRIVALIALFGVMLSTFGGVTAEELQFTDLPGTHWAYTYVSEMTKNSVITGYPDGGFQPDRNVSRAEFAKMLAVASQKSVYDINTLDFSDVGESDWYFDYVYAVEDCFNYYIEDGEKLFKPQEGARREDVAVALVKALNIEIPEFEESVVLKMFTDSEEISEDARTYVAIAIETGLVSGYDDLTFKPKNTVTRAEAATLLCRAFIEYGKQRWIWEDVMCEWAGGKGYKSDGTLYTPQSDDEYTWGKSMRTYMSYTPKDKPIEVNEGEVWKTQLSMSLLIKNNTTGENIVTLAPIVICDENDNVIWTKKPESGVNVFQFRIPQDGKKMYLTYRNSQPFMLQKKVLKPVEEIDTESIAAKIEKLKADIESRYAIYAQNKPLLKENDKAYVIFVVDDLKDCVSTYADMFIERNIPLCLAVPPQNLKQAAANGTESRKQVAQRVVNAGGEVLTHHGAALTVENFDEEAYNSFVTSKEMLEREGFEVNGTILVGGQTQADIEALRPEMEKWTSYLYEYSDRCGVAEPYWHQRVGMYPAYLPYERYQAKLATAIENKELIVFYWHDAKNISDEDLAKYLDYFQSLSTDDIEAVTYKTYYDKFLYNAE